MPVNRRKATSKDSAKRLARAKLPVVILQAVEDGLCSCGSADCTSPGKHPDGRLVPQGMKDATRDVNLIEQWWDRCPAGNVGVATGAEAGIVVLDVDKKSGGLETLERQIEEHGPLPETVKVHTGGGGAHFYFKHPGGKVKSTAGVLGAGLDIRADGGMVVAPPSMHASGQRYRWARPGGFRRERVAEMPAWMRETLAKPKTVRQQRDSSDDEGRIYPEGERNDALTRVAGRLRSSGLSGSGLMAALMAENETRCQPPLAESEVRSIAEGIKRYPPGPPPKVTARTAPYEAFPVEAFPEPVAKIIRAAATAIGCDIAYLAVPLLSVAAAAIGISRQAKLKNSWSEPSVVWTVIVGESGTLKSPAMDFVLAPIRCRQDEAFEKHKADLEAYTAAGEDGPKPRAERYLCADLTVESVVTILQFNPRGILVARDELSGWMQSFNAYKAGKGGDVSQWLEASRAGQMLVDRKTGDQRTIYARRAAVSITGGIQPGILRRCLGDEHRESGLAARLLIAMPPRTAKRWSDADIEPSTPWQYGKIIEILYRLQPNESTPVDVPLTASAKKLWVEFYNEFAEEQQGLAGDLAAAWAKLEGYAARLALIIECLTWASKPGSRGSRGPKEIRRESLQAAITMTRWFSREARRLYSVIEENEEEADHRKLLEFIRLQGGKATARDVARGMSGKYRSSDQAAEALQGLVDAGLGEWKSPKPTRKGGRPTHVFILTDETAADETAA